jgi:hypothetical protein
VELVESAAARPIAAVASALDLSCATSSKGAAAVVSVPAVDILTAVPLISTGGISCWVVAGPLDDASGPVESDSTVSP